MYSISDLIHENESLPANFETMYKRFSYITFLPLQVNAGSGQMEDGRNTAWVQLLGNYKSFYSSHDDRNADVTFDNAVIKNLLVKFGYEFLKKQNLELSRVKAFFDENYVNKRFITLPVGEETPVYEYKNNMRNLVKNQSQMIIADNFDLAAFISEVEKSKKASK